MKNVVKVPPVLKPGDTIGLFAPAGPVPKKEIITEGCRILENLGFKVKYDDGVFQKENYLAGPDHRRSAELMNLWMDKEINALLAIRGGYGTSRIIAELDFEQIRKNPKTIIGFSDLTFLLNGIQTLTSQVTFHGPMLSTLVRDGMEAAKTLMEALTKTGKKEIKPKKLNIVRAGNCQGTLMGGNLTNLVHLIGTPYEPEWNKTILFLEDINEPAYKVDRMLTHLKLAGRLDKVAGILMGMFLDDKLNQAQDTEMILRRMLELSNEKTPLWTNFPVGHGPDNIVMPLGVNATMDSRNGILSYDYEPQPSELQQ